MLMFGCQAQDAWDTSVSIDVAGETVRFFHTAKSGVDRIWIDRCATAMPCSCLCQHGPFLKKSQ